MRRHVHRAVPRWRCYRVIPWQELRRMYKRRFRMLRYLKELFKDDISQHGPWMTLAMWVGPVTMYAGGMWLMALAIADMAVHLIR